MTALRETLDFLAEQLRAAPVGPSTALLNAQVLVALDAADRKLGKLAERLAEAANHRGRRNGSE